MERPDEQNNHHAPSRKQAGKKISNLLKTFQDTKPSPAFAAHMHGPSAAEAAPAPDPSAPDPSAPEEEDIDSSDEGEADDYHDDAPLRDRKMPAASELRSEPPQYFFPARASAQLDTPETSSDASPNVMFSPCARGYGSSPLANGSGGAREDAFLAQRMNAQMNFMNMQRMPYVYAQPNGPQYMMQPGPGYAMGGMPMHAMYPPQMHSAVPMPMQGMLHPSAQSMAHAHGMPLGMAHGMSQGMPQGMQQGMYGAMAAGRHVQQPAMAWGGMHPPAVDSTAGGSPIYNLPMSPIIADPSARGFNMMPYGNPYTQMMYSMPPQQPPQSQPHSYDSQAHPHSYDSQAHPHSYDSQAHPHSYDSQAHPHVVMAGPGPGPASVSGQMSSTLMPGVIQYRSARRKRFKSSGESIYPKGISKAGNSWRIQVQVLSDEFVTVPLGNSLETKTVMKKYRFSRNMADYNAALWLYEVAILLSDRPSTIEDQIATGNYSVLVAQGLVMNMDDYYVELGRQVLNFAKMEAGNTVEVPMAIRAYNNITPRTGPSIARQGRSLCDP